MFSFSKSFPSDKNKKVNKLTCSQHNKPLANHSAVPSVVLNSFFSLTNEVENQLLSQLPICKVIKVIWGQIHSSIPVPGTAQAPGRSHQMLFAGGLFRTFPKALIRCLRFALRSLQNSGNLVMGCGVNCPSSSAGKKSLWRFSLLGAEGDQPRSGPGEGLGFSSCWC